MKKSILLLTFILSSILSYSANYYVNDNSTTGDIYCSVVGNNTNNGTSTSTPKLTLRNLWNTYGPSGTNVLTSGDIIYIDAGTYSDATDDNFAISINGITFRGAGQNKTIFDHNYGGGVPPYPHTDYFMYITASNTVIEKMQITEYENQGTQTAAGRSGQAITINGATGVALNSVFFNKNGDVGGNPALTILSNSTVTLNEGGGACNLLSSQYSGGVEVYGSDVNLTINDYVLAYNYKGGSDGGGLRIEGHQTTTVVTINNSLITQNYAARGGGIAMVNGTLNVNNSIISDNNASVATEFGGVYDNTYGGGVYISAGTATFTGCTFSGNSGGNTHASAPNPDGTYLRGGGIAARYIGSAGAFSAPVTKTIALTVTNCRFFSNQSNSVGVDVYGANGSGNACNITVSNGQFTAATGFYNFRGDATSSVSSLNVTTSGTGLTSAGTNVSYTSAASGYTGNPIVPTYTGTCATAITLPIELLYFKGVSVNGYNHLTWSTASEYNNDYFTIEKTRDGTYYYNIAVINGAGNSRSILKYEYDDRDIFDEITYYVLKQTDYDGRYKRSDIISIDNRKTGGPVLIKVTNLLGQEVSNEYRGILLFIYSDGSVIKRFF